MMRKGISIIILNWNHEFLLPRSVNSALKAVRLLHEQAIDADILVLDDCSRDGSLTLLRQLEALYADDGLKVKAYDQHQGVVALRNQALRSARFQFILFLDADNALFPDNLPIFYQAMMDTRAAMIYGNVVRHGATSTYLDLFSNEALQPHIFDLNYIDMFALFDRIQLLDLGGFHEYVLMQGHEDWELIMHLVANGRSLVFVPVMMGIYFETPQSIVKGFHGESAREDRKQYIGRVFDQLGIRRQQNMNTQHKIYHPDIGYL